ncbi:MAG TPA: gamma-glutamyl-gamma-aminobutyrate hydrolase family protein, partial [Burkholderiaceae bacterium]|nr:gamma-glutamyl-gamma-aminobutyrate hydrolase family protein [Burkholderiaceae bacterium]
GTRLAGLYPGVARATVNSVHHQGVKDLARDFVVEAVSSDDGVVEAFRWSGASYVAAVQWHPEFHDWTRTELLSGDPLLADFLQATRAARNEIARIGM